MRIAVVGVGDYTDSADVRQRHRATKVYVTRPLMGFSTPEEPSVPISSGFVE